MVHLENIPPCKRNVSAVKRKQNCLKQNICIKRPLEKYPACASQPAEPEPDSIFPCGRALHPYFIPLLASHHCAQGRICVTGNFQGFIDAFILVLFALNSAHWTKLCKVSKDCNIFLKIQRDIYGTCLLTGVALQN